MLWLCARPRCTPGRSLGWALRRTLGSLGLLLPLATRALPMLLLFVTFLFINTEVWQVASSLTAGCSGDRPAVRPRRDRIPAGAAGRGARRVDDDVDADEMVEACRRRRWSEAAASWPPTTRTDPAAMPRCAGCEKANLVLVLLIAQAVQVLLLSLAVFAFFLVFGVVAIDGDVVERGPG